MNGNIAGYDYPSRKAWRRMSQAILRDLEQTSSEELLSRLQAIKEPMFPDMEFPDPTMRELLWCKLQDWFTDRIGYAVWVSAAERKSS